MESFGTRLERYRDTEAGQTGPEYVERPLAPEIANIMGETATEVKQAIGIDIKNAKFRDDLPPGVLGQYDLSNNQISLSEAVNDPKYLEHVATHEAFHANNHNQADERVQSTAVEEALTELATKQHTGKTIAYPTEISEVRTAANKTGQNVSDLVSWYQKGQNDKINAWIQSLPAANDNDYSLAA